MIELAKRERFLIHFQPECYDSAYSINGAPEHMANEDIRRFWLHLVESKKHGAPISSSEEYLKYISSWDNYAVTSFHEPAKRCAAGRGYLFIDATGYAYPCAYTKGKTTGISMLNDDWTKSFSGQHPGTKCIVGPMLEFNMLFDKPLSSITNAWSNIL